MPAADDTMHRANQLKIAYLMSAERDIAGAGTPNFRYLICSVPRSGSSLVAQMLTDTGIAGDPLEYLNPAYIRANLAQHPEMRMRPGMPLNEYLAAIEWRRTTANGLFGIKLHHSHFSRYWAEAPDGGARFLRRFERVLLIHRRDKAAQAVSYFRAQHSGSWSSLTDRFAAAGDGRPAEPAYDAAALGEILAYLIAQEHGWRKCLEQNGIMYAQIAYEDFISDYEGGSRRVLDLLGLDGAKARIPPAGLDRQGRPDCPLVSRFKRDLGMDANPAAGRELRT
ncbi:MAG: Stf0 family sulfotransferase [Arenimonas sp.]